jgi:hypothetical protein
MLRAVLPTLKYKRVAVSNSALFENVLSVLPYFVILFDLVPADTFLGTLLTQTFVLANHYRRREIATYPHLLAHVNLGCTIVGYPKLNTYISKSISDK